MLTVKSLSILTTKKRNPKAETPKAESKSFIFKVESQKLKLYYIWHFQTVFEGVHSISMRGGGLY